PSWLSSSPTSDIEPPWASPRRLFTLIRWGSRMAQGFERLYRAYVRLLSWLGILCGLITFAIMWLIDANALMRKLFNTPVPGAFELTEAGLVLIVFLSLAYTQSRRGHIRVTL